MWNGYTRWFWMLIVSWSSVSAHLIRPKCLPAPANCTFVRHQRGIENYPVYRVNDIQLNMGLAESEELDMKCVDRNLAIDDKSLPKFIQHTHFDNVDIFDCAPPLESYASALAGLNITSFRQLLLRFELCDEKIALSPHHFTDMNIPALSISCMAFDIPNMDFSFLKPLINLKQLTLKGLVIPSLPPWNWVRHIDLSDSTPEDQSQPWGGCGDLEELVISDYKASTLPSGWLADCSRLTVLHLNKFSKLYQLPTKMIDSEFLRVLKINYCQLEELPQDMFGRTKNLRVLDLTHNALESIDRQHFSAIPFLEELYLSHNWFQAIGIVELEPLKHLRSLHLNRNWLEDTCQYTTEKNISINPWPQLPALEYLSLRESGASKLCEEWSDSLAALKILNLTGTAIKELQYHDIQLIRANNWEVDFRKSDIEAIVYEKIDYIDVMKTSDMIQNKATIWLDSPHDCDCRWYWFSLALQGRPDHITLPDLKCLQQWGKIEDPVPFDLLPPEWFICKIECEPGCKCYRRLHDNTTQANCSGAGLGHIPHVPHMREIHLANNHIETLSLSDLSEELEYMDVQYNRLSAVDEETALKMFRRHTLYRLEGNPILCSCKNSHFINTLHHHHNQIIDYENLTCVDGQKVEHVDIDAVCLKEHTPLVTGVLGTLALIFLIAVVIYYQYKTEIRIILHSWGYCAFCYDEEENDKDKIYDVFVSFAHGDSPFVMDELVPGLEAKPDNFAVCVHYRDWMPGEYIPSQIARSVEASRRTLIVLSKNFLASIWGLLEFRAAHVQALKDGRVRLIIVLLEDVSDDEKMDDELRAYLKTNTYIKREDPWFWRKLRYVLPHRNHDEKRMREAGQRVAELMRPTDPPAVPRGTQGLQMLSIEAAPHEARDEEAQVAIE